MKTLTLTVLSLLTLTGFNVHAAKEKVTEQECSKSIIKAYQKSNAKFVACRTFHQKVDGRDYLVFLDIHTDDQGMEQGRVRYFSKKPKESDYTLHFNMDDFGEYFLKVITGKDKKEDFIAIVDINSDGWLEVVLRKYANPSALIVMHSFNSQSKKIKELGILEKDFGEAEFFPYIVSHYDDQVILAPSKITRVAKDGVKTSYKWVGTYFSQVKK
jgi:hypothetical protein